MSKFLTWLLGVLFPELSPRVRVRQVRDKQRLPSVMPSSVTRVRSVTPSNGRLKVRADRRQLWQVRGWLPDGKTRLRGAFRSQYGSVAGEINLDKAGRPKDVYVVNPPEGIRRNDCFRPRKKGLWWVHFSVVPRDIDSAIVAVEDLVRQALTPK